MITSNLPVLFNKTRFTSETIPLDAERGNNVKSLRQVGRLEQMNPFIVKHKSAKLHQKDFIWFYSNSGMRRYFKGDMNIGQLGFLGTLSLAYAGYNSGVSFDYVRFDKTTLRANKKTLKGNKKRVNSLQGVRSFTVLRHGIRVEKQVQARQFVVDLPFMFFNGEARDVLAMLLTKDGLPTVDPVASPTPPALSYFSTDKMTSGVKELAMPEEDFGDLEPISEEEILKAEEPVVKEKVKREKKEGDDEEEESLGPTSINMEGGEALGWEPKFIPWSRFMNDSKISINCPKSLLMKMGESIQGVVAKKVKGNSYVFSFRAIVKAEEAEVLTSTSFEAARSLDMYALLESHVKTRFGSLVRFPPKYVVPLPKIHAETPAGDNDYRGNADGVGVSPEGTLLFLPKGVNKINQMEGSLTRLLQDDNGVLAINTDAPGFSVSNPVKLPQDLIYTDWTNLKLVYVNTANHIDIMSVDRVIPATVVHYARAMQDPFFGNNRLKSVFSYSLVLAKQLGKIPDSVEFEGLFQLGVKVSEIDPSKFSVVHFFENKDSHPEFQELYGGFKETLETLKANISVAFERFAVETVMKVAGFLTALIDFCADVKQSRAADEAARKVYLEGGLDPHHKLEPVPYVAEGMRFMPHQVKVDNFTRGNPKLTVLGVQAGGGKTFLAIHHILKRLKAGVSPCLIQCPAHLVHQYQEELVTMCDARVNSIPITGYTWKRHGPEALARMILRSPINTVVLVDYNIMKKANTTGYGVQAEKIFPVIDFLRQFNFELVVCDESHFLKKEGGLRNASAHRLLAQIPEKVLMSGTLVADRITDLVKQIALLDPTVFGSVTDFEDKYALEKKGNKVTKWQPGFESMVMKKLRENVCFVQIMRKEWAALLPPKTSEIHSVEMSADQRRVYNMIVTDAVRELQERAKTNAKLRKLMNVVQGTDYDTSDEDNTIDADAQEEDEDDKDIDPDINDMFIDDLVRPYIARLEAFTSAPGLDIVGAVELKGSDLVSPKIQAAVALAEKHINEGIPGKIIIFCNYKHTADALNDWIQKTSLASKSIYYTATNKEECLAKFNKKPELKVMFGISSSMDTGLNLQKASRLIRLESVWTPGVYEQGNSRIERPDLKSGDKDPRPHLYIDSFVVEGTIDVSKTAYLLSKLITAEKFYNSGNPAYDNITTPELFKMSIENIFNMSSLVTLDEYYQSSRELQLVINADYADYRKNHGELVLTKLDRTTNLPGSKLMLRTPYAPGLSIYGASQLGLVRYDEFMGLNAADLVEDENENEEEEDANQKQLSAAETLKVKGLAVHTDEGDGEIIRAGKKRLQIRLPNGSRIVRNKLSVFIITRKSTNNLDIKLQQQKMLGDMPLDQQPEVPAEIPRKAPKKERVVEEVEEEVEDEGISLEFTAYNDMLCLQLLSIDTDSIAQMQHYGFSAMKTFVYTQMKNPLQMLRLFRLWAAHGMVSDEGTRDVIQQAYIHFKKFGANATFYGLANKIKFKNWLMMDFRPNPNKMLFQPFPMVTKDKLFVCLPYGSGQPGTQNALRLSAKSRKDPDTKEVIPGFTGKWRLKKGEENIVVFLKDKGAGRDLIKRMIADGVKIANPEELKEGFKELRVFVSR